MTKDSWAWRVRISTLINITWWSICFCQYLKQRIKGCIVKGQTWRWDEKTCSRKLEVANPATSGEVHHKIESKENKCTMLSDRIIRGLVINFVTARMQYSIFATIGDLRGWHWHYRWMSNNWQEWNEATWWMNDSSRTVFTTLWSWSNNCHVVESEI